ncbi:MAG: hypothetical protein R2715_21105 [Ilumatobacteraceae bacterium]
MNVTFNERNGQVPTGLGAADADLHGRLVKHLESEGELVGEYERLVASPSPYVSFLAGLIAEDERRHHGIYEEWIDSLENIAELQFSGVPTGLDAEHVTELRSILDRLTEAELQDIEDLDELQQRRRHAGPDPVRLVLEVMRMDTEKHLRILSS